MDALEWLRLQLEWGADESIGDEAPDRRGRVVAMAEVAPEPLPRPALMTAPVPPSVAPTGAGAVAQARSLAAGAQTPDAVRAALAAFDLCALRATATNLVFSDGDPASRIVLLADVPGAAEDRAGLPFAGAAAGFLDQMLAACGLQRPALLATSLLPWRPPGDRKPTDTEVALCLPFALRHLELLAPRYVLLFGNLAVRSLVPGDSRRSRAGWLTIGEPALSPPIAALGFPSVLHIQANAAAKRDAWANLLRLRRALDGSGGGPAALAPAA